MEPSLLILSTGASLKSDLAVEKFASHLGVPVRRHELTQPVSGSGEFGGPSESVALSAESCRNLRIFPWFEGWLKSKKHVFIYGFEGAGADSELLRVITNGAWHGTGVVRAATKTYSFPAVQNGCGFPVCGSGYAVEAMPSDCSFEGRPSAETRTWMTLNGAGKFLEARFGSAAVYMLPDANLIDLDTSPGPEGSLRPYYAQLLAMGIFVRRAFGRRCWTAAASGGTVTIDDPLLKKRYGFVRYEPLLRELSRAEYSLTIAFIPYNHRRSDPKVTSLLRQHDSRFSIAVHGLDHTKAEFADEDGQLLRRKAWSALERMQSHSRRSGMAFDDVMIFPQGKFSVQAVGALKHCGYLAAVNSTPWPVNFGEQALTIRDLLEVAVTRYESLPIFSRRYPLDVFDFAFDAFFQKPLLVVEHDEFFREGYGALSNYVERLRNLPSLRTKWQPLREVLTASCLLRECRPGHMAARFFTPVLRLANVGSETCVYSLSKTETAESVRAVFCNGMEVPHDLRSGILSCEVQLSPGEKCELRVSYAEPERVFFTPSFKYRCRTFARRRLSEMRDNYFRNTPLLLSAAQTVKRLLT